MYSKFSDFISEIKPLSFFKQRERHNHFAHADIYQRKVVHSLVSKSWDERTNFDSAPKAFMAKFFNQKETVLALKTATFPYQKVRYRKFQKPKSIFTQRGAVRSVRCAPGFLWSTLWDGIEEIQCRTLQTPHFQDVLSLFYERQGSEFIADTIPTLALWNLRKPECEVTLSWLEELALFDEHQPPSRQQSLKAINYIIRGRKKYLQTLQTVLSVAPVTKRRYMQEDKKLATSEQQLFLPINEDHGLNRMERSALLYKLKMALIFLLSEKLIEEFRQYERQSDEFYQRLNRYLGEVRRHVAALLFVQSLKRNTEKDKNKRQSARYRKPKIDNFLIRSIETASGRLKTAMQILYLTGLRPVELEKGVKITVTEDKLCFEVKGAKIRHKPGASSGQEWRKFAIPKTELPLSFQNWARLSAGSAGIFSVKRETLWRFFRQFKKQNAEFRNLRPYSFRHGFASALKLAGFSPALIAQAMGHQSTRTQRKYGSAKERKSGTFLHPAQALEDIDAAAEVRVYESSLDFAALNEAGVNEAGVDADTPEKNGTTSDASNGANDKAAEASKDTEAAKPDNPDFDPDPFGF